MEVVELPVDMSPGGPGQVRVGIHRRGPLPAGDLDGFDILLSADADAPRPWVGLAADRLDAAIAELEAKIAAQPVASAAAAQVMRMSAQRRFRLGPGAGVPRPIPCCWPRTASGPGGRRPRCGRGPATTARGSRSPETARALSIRLERPAARNAFDARMRDELCEALAFALEHPDALPVTLTGAGPAPSAPAATSTSSGPPPIPARRI